MQVIQLYLQVFGTDGTGTSFTISTCNTFGGAQSEKFRVTNSGNVGIGTTSPSRRLDLNIGGDQTWFEINTSRAANEAMLQLVHSAGNRAAAIRYANADDGWKVGINGTEAFTFANASY